MGWQMRNPFKKAQVHGPNVAGEFGFAHPFGVVYRKRPLPPVDNAAQYAYQTYLSPIWTPIGPGIPNKRDIGTAPVSYALQGILAVPVTGPGILAGQFASGPLTNVDSTESPLPVMPAGSYAIPAI